MSRMVALDAPCTRCRRNMVPLGWRRVPGGAVRYGARGYCKVCYTHLFLRPFPTVPVGPWRRDDLLAEWDFLRRQGFTMRQAVERLGISYYALDRALARAKRDGDERAVRRVLS